MIVNKNIVDWDDDDPDKNYRENRMRFWNALKKCRNDMVDVFEFNMNTFNYYLKEQYGLQVIMSGDKITDKYEIVDEKKFLIFKLKYM